MAADPLATLPSGVKLFLRYLHNLISEKLTDHNYPAWSNSVKTTLSANLLLSWVDGIGIVPPVNVTVTDKDGTNSTEFLQKFNLKLIIRSHEGPDARENRPELGNMDKGYTIDHEVTSGKLITLFSAPDYPQFQATEDRYRNKGAYIVLEPPNFDTPKFHSFDAVTPRPKVNESLL